MSSEIYTQLSQLEELVKFEQLNKESLVLLDELLHILYKSGKVTGEIREILIRFREYLESNNTESKTKNLTLYHLNKLIDRKLTDFSTQISRDRCRDVYSLVKEYIERNGIQICSIPYNIMCLLDKQFTDKQVDKIILYIELLINNVQITDTLCNELDIDIKEIDKSIKSVESILNTINVNTYTSYTTRDEGDIYDREHKGGGDETVFHSQSELPMNLDLLNHVFRSLQKFKKSNYYVTNSYASQTLFCSKLAHLLIHIHMSRAEDVPLPRRFLEENGYELFTAMDVYNTEDHFKTTTIYGLQSLKLLTITKHASDGNCREVSLTKTGKACTAILALTNTKIGLNQLELRMGDIVGNDPKFQYYIEHKDFIPNVGLLNSVLAKLKSTTINIKKFIKNFKESYPICTMTPQDYKQFFSENVYKFETMDTDDLDVLVSYDNDLRYMTTGYEIKYSKNYERVMFTNVFTLSYTGRLFQRYGLQGITRKSKTILHDGKINYDIPSSQIRILLMLLEQVYEKFGHEFTDEDKLMYEQRSVLQRYIEDPLFVSNILIESGLSKEHWKRCIYALLFGAKLDSSYQKSAIKAVVTYNEFLNPHFDKDKFFQHIYQISAPIYLWYKYIEKYARNYEMSAEAQAMFYQTCYYFNISDRTHEDYMFNGVTFVPKTHHIFDDLKQLNAFFLQGIESAFIFNLITMFPNLTISYEFDGLVVQKQLDERLLEIVRRQSGFLNGTVIVKEFE